MINTNYRLKQMKKTMLKGGCLLLCTLALTGCVPKVGPTPPPLPTQQPAASQAAATPTAAASAQPTQVIPEEPAVQLVNPETLEQEQTLTISREGEQEEMTALRQIAQAGYVIYTLPDFAWSEQENLGMAIPAATSALDAGITLKIIADAGLQPQALLEQAKLEMANYTFEQRDSGLAVPAGAGGIVGAYGEKGDAIAQISAFTLGSGTYAAVLTYPREAAEGGLVLLHAMVSTMVAYQ